MSNHLIIGLGGTGGRIIRALRKTIYQEYRKHQPDTVNVEYLYIDSSAEMMAQDDPTWKTLGKSVQLSENQKLLIRGGVDLKQLLENINSYPGIKPWIGNKEQWQEILNSIVGEVLGGQKRRLGRFLLACKINDFKKQLSDRVRDLQNTGTTAVTFHICCGLAGGTGSGSIVDVTAQIRAAYPDVKNYRIILYTLLPETHPKANWNTGNYHANGYAALVELNAMSVGVWQPHDIQGRGERLQLQDPFNGCYLFFNQNENGLSVDTEHDLPVIVADFLYQKLVVAEQTGWDSLGRMENAENGDGTPECAPNTQRAERSKRFLTFGIKRLIVPEQEIKEYMTYQFAQQAVLQTLYNNWLDSVSYADEAKNLAFNQEVAKKEVLERWKLTEDHLCLSLGILADEISSKKWKPISQDWTDVISHFMSLARENPDKKLWLHDLTLLCQRRFEEQYRQHGVKKFYEMAEKRHRDHAKEIRRLVEAELFGSWQNGTRSLHEVEKLADALLELLDQQYQVCAEKITQNRDYGEVTEQKVAANAKEWAAVGMLSALVGKYDTLLQAQQLCLRDLYFYRTYERAWQFAQMLLATLKTEISTLKSEVARSKSLFTELNKEFKNKIAGRINEQGQVDLRRPVVQFYQPELVKNFTQVLLRDKRLQEAQTTQVRQILIQQLGEAPDFSTFNNRLLRQQVIDFIESRCEGLAVDAHNNLIASERDKVAQLNVSVIERLSRHFSGDEDGLKSYLQKLVDSAGNYLLFNPAEVTKTGDGIPSTPTKVTHFGVILPQAPESKDFSDRLQATIKGCYSGNSEFIRSNRRSEIVLISLSNLFPLRFVEQLNFLKKQHDSRITNSNNKERTRLEVYCEGDGAQYPVLFVDAEGPKTSGLPLLLIANALDIVQNYTNPTTGKSELLLISHDDDGMENDPIRFGTSLIKAVDELNAANVELLKKEVEKSLQKDYQHVDNQKELKQKVVGLVNGIKGQRNGDIDDPVYKRFREAGKKANEMIEKGNGQHGTV